MTTQNFKVLWISLLLLAGTVSYNGCAAQRPDGSSSLSNSGEDAEEISQNEPGSFDFNDVEFADPEAGTGIAPGDITDILGFIGSPGNYRSEDLTRAFYIFSSNRICEYNTPKETGVILPNSLVARIDRVRPDLKDVCMEAVIPAPEDTGGGAASMTSIRYAFVGFRGTNDCNLEFYLTHPEVRANQLTIQLRIGGLQRNLLQDTARPAVSNAFFRLKCSDFGMVVTDRRAGEYKSQMTIRVNNQTSFSNSLLLRL